MYDDWMWDRREQARFDRVIDVNNDVLRDVLRDILRRILRNDLL